MFRPPAFSALLLLMLGLAISAGTVAEAGESETQLGPSVLAVSEDARTLYVACADARQVAWVDLPGGEVMRCVPVPAEPVGLLLTPDGSRLIVICAAARSSVVVLDAVSGQLLDTIPAGHTATAAALAPDGMRLYVCNRFDHDVSVIDLAAGEPVTRIPAVREPIAIAIAPDGQTVLVANHLPHTRTDAAFKGNVAAKITVIDTGTWQTAAIELPHGANGLRGLSISPDGRLALVTHLLSNFEMVPFRVETGWINVNVVSILDVPQHKLLRTIGLDRFDLGAGNPWDVVWTADGETVCVSISGTHELGVIRTADLLSDFAQRTMQPMMTAWPTYPSLGQSLWRRISLPGNGPRGLAAAGSTIYIAEYFSDTVAVVDLQEATETASLPLGPVPELSQRRHGELLFHDATLCYQHWQSCASCHPDARADGLNWDLINDGIGNPKNTKSMLLAHQTPPSMTRGVRASAELAVRAGFTHILFSDPPDEVSAAIDVYLRSLEPVPSPHLVDGRLSAAAERGREVFHSDSVACNQCHPAPWYTDLKTHDVGTRSLNDPDGRYDTPTLVEVWRTAPYLHDGRYTTIRQVLVEGRHGLTRGRLEQLSDQQIDDLVEYVLSL